MLDLELERESLKLRRSLGFNSDLLEEVLIYYNELKVAISKNYPDLKIIEDFHNDQNENDICWEITKTEDQKYIIHVSDKDDFNKKIGIIAGLHQIEGGLKEDDKCKKDLYFARAFFMPRMLFYEAALKYTSGTDILLRATSSAFNISQNSIRSRGRDLDLLI